MRRKSEKKVREEKRRIRKIKEESQKKAVKTEKVRRKKMQVGEKVAKSGNIVFFLSGDLWPRTVKN